MNVLLEATGLNISLLTYPNTNYLPKLRFNLTEALFFLQKCSIFKYIYMYIYLLVFNRNTEAFRLFLRHFDKVKNRRDGIFVFGTDFEIKFLKKKTFSIQFASISMAVSLVASMQPPRPPRTHHKVAFDALLLQYSNGRGVEHLRHPDESLQLRIARPVRRNTPHVTPNAI